MAVALVAGQIAFNNAFGGSVGVAFPGNNTAGNLILVDGVMLAGNTPGVSDSQGNTYSALVTSDDNGSTKIVMFYAANCKAGANTVTLTSGASTIQCYISEFSGLATVTPLDQSNHSNGFSGTPVGPSITTTANGELIIGFIYNGSGTGGVGTGFTVVNNNGNTAIDEYQIQTSSGSIAVQFTIGSVSWQVLAASYKAAGGGAAFIAPQPRLIQQAVKRASLY